MAVATLTRPKKRRAAKVRPVMTNGRARRRRTIKLDEFYAMPEGPPEEYDEGELICLAEPHGRHTRIQGKLFLSVHAHVTQNKSGEVWLPINVQLDNRHSFAPDLTFVSAENRSRYNEKLGRVIGAPDLVAEIISPRGGRQRDRIRKFKVYYECGVQWYWILDPDERIIEEYHWGAEGYIVTSRVDEGAFTPGAFPGLKIELDELFSAAAEE